MFWFYMSVAALAGVLVAIVLHRMTRPR